MAEDEPFLTRWSRRKITEKQQSPAPEADPIMEPELVAEPEVLNDDPDQTDAGPAADSDVGEAVGSPADEAEPERHPAEDIDIEALTKESDFTIFMQKGVPAALRRQALRKLWTSDPVLANLDGLNDYEDMEWTYGISEKATTSWKLGRGFLTDRDLGLETDDPVEEMMPGDAGPDDAGQDDTAQDDSGPEEAIPEAAASEPAASEAAPAGDDASADDLANASDADASSNEAVDDADVADRASPIGKTGRS